ncbi:MAG TPA: SDR family oxidoreductase [Gemmatimonadaceae bacterium]|nr:SDR family oxidoreductase [Gemmatimonadaceae bacterium]
MTYDPFDLSGRVAVITGGFGVLGGSMAEGLAKAGVRIAVLGLEQAAADAKAAQLRELGSDAFGIEANVLEREPLLRARDEVMKRWGKIDILINAAGGNVARARTDAGPVFGLPFDAFDEVVRLNLHGSVYPTLIFGEAMAERESGTGSIVNISSMAALTAISGVLGYSVAKAGIDNFTRWMAVDLARRNGAKVRVNAIAPGFFVSTQNRAVLVNPDGSYTERSQRILAQTPMGRFGDASELIGVVHWLCSDASSFVTGTVIPVDGGFSIYSGV